MANWGDLSYKNRYGKPKPQTGAQSWGDLSYQNRYGQPYGQTPAPASKPAAAPVGPAAVSTSGSGLPLDPAYDAAIGGLQHKRDDALAQYAGQRPKVLADYGYTASGYDAQGNPLGLAFDPNNPFSRAALAKRTADQVKQGTQNSMASRGQLYSGALDQAQTGNEFRYQQGSDALQKALVEALGGIAQGERGAKTDYEIGAGQALGESVGRAQSTTPSPPPAAATQPGGSAYNPYTPGTPQWAAYAKQHEQSWKTDSKGRWGYYVNGKWQKA
jgi:hypothetical protein